MDGEARAFLLGDRGNLAHERDEVGAQVFDRHLLVGRQRALEALPVVGEVARRQPVDKRPLQLLHFARRHRLKASARRRDALGRILALGAVAPEDEEVVSRVVDRIEAQRRPAARKRPVEVGPRPVGDGHEIVAEGLHAGARRVADRLLVIVDFGAECAAARLDLLADADALDHRPNEARAFDLGPALQDLVFAPDFAPVHVMERADDAGRAGLTHIFQADRIVRPEPAPSLQHASPSLMCVLEQRATSRRYACRARESGHPPRLRRDSRFPLASV